MSWHLVYPTNVELSGELLLLQRSVYYSRERERELIAAS